MKNEKFDITAYQDHYAEKVRELIEAKVQGREVVAATAAAPVQTINLLDALQKSLASAQKSVRRQAARLLAPSVGTEKQTRRRNVS